MTNFQKELFNALTDPKGFSGDAYPDGTPMTNTEKWERMNDRSNDFH